MRIAVSTISLGLAGIESISYQDAPAPLPTPHVDDTIDEDGEVDAPDASLSANPSSSAKPRARHSRQNSGNRLSKLSAETRISIQSLESLEGNTRSDRSSATIRPNAPLPPAGSNPNGNGGAVGLTHDGAIPEFDFDKALMKFAVERENFLDDLSFSAGAKLQSRPPMVNPRAERIKADEADINGRRSPLRSIKGSIKGSIRRKISFRDMNSMRKQPGSVRVGTPNRPCRFLLPSWHVHRRNSSLTLTLSVA